VRRMMAATVEGLRHEDPVLHRSLKRWERLILNTVFRVHKITGQDAETVFQDIILALVEVSSVKGVPLYRWRRKLWEMERVFGTFVLLKAPRNNKKDNSRTAFAPVAEVVLVPRCAFDSLVYAKAQQTCADMLTGYFSLKHGYQIRPREVKLVRVTDRHDGICFEKRVVHSFKRVFREVNMTDLREPISGRGQEADLNCDLADLSSPNAEEDLLTKEALNSIYVNASAEAKEVLVYLLSHPGARTRKASVDLGIPLTVVRESTQFIRHSIGELAR